MSDRMTEAGWFDLEAALVACSRDRIGFGRTKARLKGALSQTKKAFESGDRATCFLRAFGRLWLDAPDEAAGYARADTEWRARWEEAERARLAEIDRVRVALDAQRRATAQANAEAQRARDEAREAAGRETEIIIREVESSSPSARECVFDSAEAAAFNRVR
jgi:hypothetical protein